MKKGKSLITGLVVLVALLIMVSGCSVARKPAPPGGTNMPNTKSAPAPTTPAPTKSLPTTPAEVDRLAARLADEAQKVSGVKKATVVLSGNTVIVGLEIKPNIEEKQTTAIKKEVVRRIKEADKRIQTVEVTTNPNIITRIKKVAEGIGQGRPISAFGREVEEILRRVVPQGK
jgi:YhcN/YlaJ family sporulation lipoprotein